MTDRETRQQALEALTIYSDAQCSPKGRNAITALREALAQPEQKTCGTCEALARTVMLDQTSHDTQRPWQGLTDEDKQTAVWTNGTFGGGALWAQQLLKERNE